MPISTVAKIAEAAMAASKSCVVDTLDVQNTFNSPNWCKIIQALAKLGNSKYLVRIATEFLRERRLCYDSNGEPKTPFITAGLHKDRSSVYFCG